MFTAKIPRSRTRHPSTAQRHKLKTRWAPTPGREISRSESKFPIAAFLLIPEAAPAIRKGFLAANKNDRLILLLLKVAGWLTACYAGPTSNYSIGLASLASPLWVFDRETKAQRIHAAAPCLLSARAGAASELHFQQQHNSLQLSNFDYCCVSCSSWGNSDFAGAERGVARSGAPSLCSRENGKLPAGTAHTC